MIKKRNSVELKGKTWAGYAAAGLTALAATANTAEADITHVVVNGGAGTASAPGDDNYFALANGSSLNFYHASVGTNGGAALFGVFNGVLTGSVVGFNASGYNYASNLTPGVNISTQNFLSAFGTMAYGNGYGNDQFLDAGDGYLAFTFNSQQQYGWARVTMDGNQPANTFTIQEYAFGDVGDSVFVGQTSAVPEPTALGLLAAGAAGLACVRRRKAS